MIERFLHDENGPVGGHSIDCVKPPIGSGNILKSIYSHSCLDIGLFPFQDIFYGLIKVLPIKSGKWLVPELSKIRDSVERVIAIDRSKLSQAFYASQQSEESQKHF